MIRNGILYCGDMIYVHMDMYYVLNRHNLFALDFHKKQINNL